MLFIPDAKSHVFPSLRLTFLGAQEGLRSSVYAHLVLTLALMVFSVLYFRRSPWC